MKQIEQLLSEKTPEIVKALSERSGWSLEKAQKFVPSAVSRILALLKGGDLDVAKLLGGSSELVSKIDTAGLAQEAGLDEQEARSGLEGIAGWIQGRVGEQAGGLAGIAGAAGKLFGKGK